jgi:hypothetical protein
MDNDATYAGERFGTPTAEAGLNRESHSSGVSWGAVTGGAFVSAALFLSLLALGAGLGLAAASPWSNSGAAASTLGAAAIVWLIFIEGVSSAMGGYLTGRLRIKWAAIHTDEVYFRDTANGLLAWAVAVVISVAFLASGAASMAGAVSENPTALGAGADDGYLVNALFRSDRLEASPQAAAARAEAAGILAHDMAQNPFPANDQAYLTRIVAAQTGMSQTAAEQQVSNVIEGARQTADQVRKTTSRFLLWSFVALFFGAFSASYAATIGGRQRDHMRAV